ncbi:MAG TPA: PEGA domain-containing protein [Polyangiaceae bacterium]|nr:PEGA domain-containing protein [Polyangiaceae bacterium]
MSLLPRARVALVILGCALVGALVDAPARADAPPPAGATNADEAAKFKRRGDELFDSSRHEDAIKFYTQAYALVPDPAVLYNRGRSFEALGRYPEALIDLEQFSRTAAPELRAKVAGIDKLIADVRARVAELEVACNVPGARVVVREHVLGAVAGQRLKVNAGLAKIEVWLEGYEPFSASVELKGGGFTRVVAFLAPKGAQSGFLVVRGPRGARVFLDGADVGQPPVERPLGAGDHRVVLKQEGFDDAERSVVVLAGRRAEVDVTLSRKPAFYTRGWFWGAVGAVAVGSVAAIVIANTSRPVEEGTLGQVRGPLVRF